MAYPALLALEHLGVLVGKTLSFELASPGVVLSHHAISCTATSNDDPLF